MSTHLPGFQSFFRVLHHFVLSILTPSTLRVKLVSFAAYVCQYRRDRGKRKGNVLFTIKQQDGYSTLGRKRTITYLAVL